MNDVKQQTRLYTEYVYQRTLCDVQIALIQNTMEEQPSENDPQRYAKWLEKNNQYWVALKKCQARRQEWHFKLQAQEQLIYEGLMEHARLNEGITIDLVDMPQPSMDEKVATAVDVLTRQVVKYVNQMESATTKEAAEECANCMQVLTASIMLIDGTIEEMQRRKHQWFESQGLIPQTSGSTIIQL